MTEGTPVNHENEPSNEHEIVLLYHEDPTTGVLLGVEVLVGSQVLREEDKGLLHLTKSGPLELGQVKKLIKLAGEFPQGHDPDLQQR